MLRSIQNLKNTRNKPPLLDKVRRRIRTKQLSNRTEKAYVQWIKRFIKGAERARYVRGFENLHPQEEREETASQYPNHVRPGDVPKGFGIQARIKPGGRNNPARATHGRDNSYAFREGRSCADAVAAAFNALSKPNSATLRQAQGRLWVYEADITGCYDNISKSWLMVNIPVEKRILRQWLSAGYVENGITYPTRKGTPQGGIISPCLANMTLDGLEAAVHNAVPWRSRVNFIRYADDFIITAKSRAILERYAIPAVKRFLAERGLQLSEEKTKITYIRDGFTFLGQTFRKHGNTLHITPSKEGVLALMRKVGTLIRKYATAPIVILIKKLNEVLRGWANYHRHVVASEAFARVAFPYFHNRGVDFSCYSYRCHGLSPFWLIELFYGKQRLHLLSSLQYQTYSNLTMFR